MPRQSRYKGSKHFTGEQGVPAPFRGIRQRDMGPATGIVEYQLKPWDRIDRIAFDYYNDDGLWWRILDANPEYLCAVDLFEQERHASGNQDTAEKTLLIPGARE